MRRLALVVVAFLALVLAPMAALAAPRSGGSFGGRSGFRSRAPSSVPRSYSGSRPAYGGGTNFVFLPTGGWGWGGYGYGGGGGMGIFGTLLLLGVVGFGVVMVTRALRRNAAGIGRRDDDDDDGYVESRPDRAFIYKIQLGLGRSARGIQERLARFAAEGDTSSEAGLGQLLQQTSLELLREKDSIRYGSLEISGPMSLTNGETKMNAAALAERSRFTVERVRGSDGTVRKSDTVVPEGAEVLEYVVVTVVLATRQAVLDVKELTDQGELKQVLAGLGSVPADALLGMEVVWTPADSQDSLTSTDLLTTYPDLRSL
jgi:uncharacterized membrane protein